MTICKYSSRAQVPSSALQLAGRHTVQVTAHIHRIDKPHKHCKVVTAETLGALRDTHAFSMNKHEAPVLSCKKSAILHGGATYNQSMMYKRTGE